MGCYIAEQLAAKGLDIYDHLPGSYDQGSRELVEKGEVRSKICNLAVWLSVPAHARGWHEGQKTGIVTMFEATRLPESFRENLDNFDTVVVPSFQNVEIFSQYHDNVHFMPLGIDPADWYYIPRQAPTNEFRFLIGGSGPRKGTDLAFKAFNKVFKTWPKDGPVPKLILKSPKPEDFYAENVTRVPGRITPEEEIDLYTTAHCYLQPSRGEGFGLQPLQAMAQGIPTILTGAHGHESFAHLGYPLKSKLAPAAYFSDGHAGEWWEPDFDQLCELMEYMYLNYEAAEALAEISAKDIAENWTWSNTADRFIGIFGDDMTPYTGSGEWRDNKLRKYHVRVQQEFACEMAGIHYRFLPGVDYYEPADVKRHLFDGGWLDNSCLTSVLPDGTEIADIGLNEQQLALMGKYSASHSYCPTCHVRLNTGVTQADDILREMEDAR
jgi:glycosyltransferase involved in cell wall biosynthesis